MGSIIPRNNKSSPSSSGNGPPMTGAALSASPSQTDAGELWKLLWLYPELPKLLGSLLRRFERTETFQWDYDSAFLIHKALELQVIYHEYRNACCAAGVTNFFDGNVLLKVDDVVYIIETFSRDLIKYHTETFESSLNRQLQCAVSFDSASLVVKTGIHYMSDAERRAGPGVGLISCQAARRLQFHAQCP